jgi:hypothetical protein
MMRPRLDWHWLWFLPLCIIVLAVVERHTVDFALAIIYLFWRRWLWSVLLSPSAAFCLTVVTASVVLPLLGLVVVALIVGGGRRPLYSIFVIVGIFLLPVITDAFVWGSFLLTFDNEGKGRLRMIPFVPWPSGRFGEY